MIDSLHLVLRCQMAYYKAHKERGNDHHTIIERCQMGHLSLNLIYIGNQLAGFVFY